MNCMEFYTYDDAKTEPEHKIEGIEEMDEYEYYMNHL